MKSFVSLLACAFILGTHILSAQTAQTKSNTTKFVINNKPVSAQQRGYLGVALSSNNDGVEINNVIPNTAAVKAGLQKGDVLVSINNQRISSTDDVTRIIGSSKPGETVTILYSRKGEAQATSAVLGKQAGGISVSSYPGSYMNYDGTGGNGSYSTYDYSAYNDNWSSQPIQTTAISPCEQLRELQGTAFLGVWIESTRDGNGAYVNGSIPNTGAQAAGLQSGDVITDIEGRKISTFNECLRTIRSHKPGDVVTVTYTRKGETRSTTARLVSIGETKRELVKILEAQCSDKVTPAEPIKGAMTDVKPTTVIPSPTVPAVVTEKEVVVTPTKELPSLKGESLNESIGATPQALTISPNPATGVVNMRFNSSSDAAFTISVVDASGRAVIEQKVNSMSGMYSAPLDLTSLARGVYIVNIHQGNAVFSEKVILQ